MANQHVNTAPELLIANEYKHAEHVEPGEVIIHRGKAYLVRKLWWITKDGHYKVVLVNSEGSRTEQWSPRMLVTCVHGVSPIVKGRSMGHGS